MNLQDFENSSPQEMLNSYKKAIDVNIITSITDSKGIIIYANEKFCEVSGFPKQELIGQSHRIINSNYHAKEFFRDLWKTISKGKTWHGEIKNKAKDGSFYWVDTVILPFSTGKENRYLSLRTLINERKELEKRKEEYLKSLEEMMDITSHKTRKPIATLLGLLELNVDEVSKDDFKKMVLYLKNSAEELDFFTREFTAHMDNLKKKMLLNTSPNKKIKS